MIFFLSTVVRYKNKRLQLTTFNNFRKHQNMLEYLHIKYNFPTPHFDPQDETLLGIISIQKKVALAACPVILLIGTAYYFLTNHNAYNSKPIPPCEPSLCELHQHEKILEGSCYCPEQPNSEESVT